MKSSIAQEESNPASGILHAPSSKVRDKIQYLISRMTLDQKIGQCFTFGFSGTVITPDIIHAIQEFHVGGLRLSPFTTTFSYFSDKDAHHDFSGGEGYQECTPKPFRQDQAPHYSPREFAGLLNRLQEYALNRPLGIPLHMVVDQEGDFSSDYNPGFINLFPSQMGLTATGNPENAYYTALVVARQLRAAGINWINSPVLDVNINPLNPEIGVRSFGDDPVLVAEFGAAMLKGFREGGLIASAKHFPGRGDSDCDAHHSQPTLLASRSRLDALELLPYTRAIREGLDSIMTAHLSCPSLDSSGLPATLSPTILNGFLRNELGFEGVITTDSITMGAIIGRFGVPEACARALQAGCDLVLMKAENKWRGQAIHEVRSWVEAGRISEEEIDAKVTRILGKKIGYGLMGDKVMVDPEKASAPIESSEHRDFARQVALDSCILLKDEAGLLPLTRKKKILLIEQMMKYRSPNNVFHHPRMLFESFCSHVSELEYVDVEMPLAPSDRERIEEKLRSGPYDAIVLTHFYWRDIGPSEYLQELMKRDLPIILVTNTPYANGGSQDAKTVVINFATCREGFSAVSDVLFGIRKPGGRWPLKNLPPSYSRPSKEIDGRI